LTQDRRTAIDDERAAKAARHCDRPLTPHSRTARDDRTGLFPLPAVAGAELREVANGVTWRGPAPPGTAAGERFPPRLRRAADRVSPLPA